MDKARDAFRTISEVSEWLDTPTYVLRFWESRFPQIKPVKRAGGRRYYRPEDMMLLGGIKKLLHFDGNTIKGVQNLIKEKGIKFVADLSPGLDEKVVSPENDADAARKAELESMVILKTEEMPEETSEAPAEEPLKLNEDNAAADTDGTDDSQEEKVTVTVRKKTRIVRPAQTEEAATDETAPETADNAESKEASETPAEEPQEATVASTEEIAAEEVVDAAPKSEEKPVIERPTLRKSNTGIHAGPFAIKPAATYSADDLQEIETLYYSLKMVRNNMKRIGNGA